MNIVVIGLGSMGKRRIRLLQKYISEESGSNDWNIYGVDKREDRRNEIEKLLHIGTFESLQDVREKTELEAAFVCTAPLSHAKIISECLENNLHIFSEINLVEDGYEKNIELAQKHNRILYLSSTPMFRKEMKYIKKWIADHGFKVSYRYHVGQYLPDWHPWENYKDFFVGDKRTNGCRELFAIELPWMTEAFGRIKETESAHRRISKLNVDYDDTYHVQIVHEDGIVGSVAFDVVSPVAQRRLEIYGENICLLWEGTPDILKAYEPADKKMMTVSLYDDVQHQEGYAGFVVENAYYDEIRDFFDCLKGNAKPKYDFCQDRETLRIIDGIGA